MRNTIRLSAAIAALTIPVMGASAGDNEKALEILKRARAHAADATTTQVSVTQDLSVQMQGMNQDMASVFEIAIERPNRLAMVLKDGMNGSTVVTDGEKLYVHVPMMGQYTESDAPESIELLLDEQSAMELGVIDAGPLPMLSPFMIKDHFAHLEAALTDGSMETTMMEQEEVAGTMCHHFQFNMPAVQIPGLGQLATMGDLDDVKTTLDCWISTGDEAVLVKVKPDVNPVFKALANSDPMMAQMGEMEMDLSMTFTDWSFGGELADEVFVFDSDGAEKIESFMGGGMPEGEAEAADALVGQEAPSFVVELLDGGELDLVKHRGDIVVLDFWATWCGPCVKALPTIIKVTDAMADQGVHFYAVDLREDAATVQKFLDKKGFDMKVAMDAKGAIAELYKVGPIPQTVIIGKDGTVEAVHIGLSPGLEDRLTEELQTLIDGGTLRDEG